MKSLSVLTQGKFVIISLIVVLAGLVVAGHFYIKTARAADRPPMIVPQPVKHQSGQACSCTANTLDCEDFPNQAEAQACFDHCIAETGFDVHDLDAESNGLACQATNFIALPTPAPTAEPTPVATPVVSQESIDGPVGQNLIYNGNFEYGFYQVPELGFEARDVGNVPNDWGWYKSNTYGKFDIDANETFGLVCLDDIELQRNPPTPTPDPADSIFAPVPGQATVPEPHISLSFFMQSTDQQDARLGVYQTVNVVPGQYYRMTMSGTVQVQSGAETLQSDDPDDPIEAQNHTFEISFDHNGGTKWDAIPFERRTIWELNEEKLEFQVSEDDEDLAEIQDFETYVRARSDKMTIFITGWRKWANWRTAIFTIDCVSLVPTTAAVAEAAAARQAAGQDQLQPVAASQSGPAQAAAASASESVVIIPPSGGIVEGSEPSVLMVLASIVIVVGLVGAGIWNVRRR